MSTTDPIRARARLEALIAAAAPSPVPAEQAIALLRRLGSLPVEDLGRLTYQALTGVVPGDDPQPPASVATGFPPFAGEVVVRAITGPDERRPTSQALLIVLDTVPASGWPSSGAPVIDLPEAEEPDGPDGTDGAGADDAAAAPPAGAPALGDGSARRDERDDAFRAMLLPERRVPLVAASDDAEPADAADDTEGPDDADAPAERRAAARAAAREQAVEFHDLVNPGFVVPTFEPLDGADAMARLVDDEQRAHTGGGRRRRRRRRQARDRTVLVVAVLVVVLLLVLLYLSRRGGDEGTDPTPGAQGPGQGASRSTTHASVAESSARR